ARVAPLGRWSKGGGGQPQGHSARTISWRTGGTPVPPDEGRRPRGSSLARWHRRPAGAQKILRIRRRAPGGRNKADRASRRWARLVWRLGEGPSSRGRSAPARDGDAGSRPGRERIAGSATGAEAVAGRASRGPLGSAAIGVGRVGE